MDMFVEETHKNHNLTSSQFEAYFKFVSDNSILTRLTRLPVNNQITVQHEHEGKVP